MAPIETLPVGHSVSDLPRQWKCCGRSADRRPDLAQAREIVWSLGFSGNVLPAFLVAWIIPAISITCGRGRHFPTCVAWMAFLAWDAGTYFQSLARRNVTNPAHVLTFNSVRR